MSNAIPMPDSVDTMMINKKSIDNLSCSSTTFSFDSVFANVSEDLN